MDQFDALDADGNGVLSPEELAPVVAGVANSQPYDVTYAQCKKFADVFDKDGNGTIERIEFLAFTQFVMVMRFIEAEEAEMMVEEEPPMQQGRRKSVTESLGCP